MTREEFKNHLLHVDLDTEETQLEAARRIYEETGECTWGCTKGLIEVDPTGPEDMPKHIRCDCCNIEQEESDFSGSTNEDR